MCTTTSKPCCLFGDIVKHQRPPSNVVLEVFLELEKAPRETARVCEGNKQNINLILNPKERAWGLISWGVNLGGRGGDTFDKELMKWV